MKDETSLDDVIANLRETISVATPGNWWIDSQGAAMVAFLPDGGMEFVFFNDDRKVPLTRHEDTGNLSNWRNDNDATYIAQANPAVMTRLLDRIKELESALKEKE